MVVGLNAPLGEGRFGRSHRPRGWAAVSAAWTAEDVSPS